MNKYQQFKHLLEYFVAHLEFCVTNNITNRGYIEYIDGINDFSRGGQGHKTHRIQNQIREWENFGSGNIFININPTVYQGKGCYLNWEDTAINVIAIWNNNSIIELKIVKDAYPISNSKNVLGCSLSQLGIFDGKSPNTTLETFFDKFDSLKIKWNKKQQHIKNMNTIHPYTNLLKHAHNLILTGPPGTGKTFLSKQIAKQMIGVQTDEELEKSGQYTFVQFHPSYDYTDFVEGLRPTKPDVNGNLGFELKNGIFKEFCKKAIGVTAIATGHIDKFTLDDYEKYLQTLGLKEVTIKNYKHRIEQLLGKDINSRNEVINRSIYTTLDEICENFDDIRDFDTANNFHNQFSASVSNLISLKENLSTKQYKTSEIKPIFIFVIDEINRGEISKIFGELFFSIDPGYRGKKGAVKTQYSNLHDDENEVFYVPDNVYIIGCMNDIDRSVESFDFAMRRRFTWKEISSEQSAENMGLIQETKDRMMKLNECISRIEGLNNSYHIGGAYFLDTFGTSRTDYDNIWELRIEPLLIEYLRGLPMQNQILDELKNAYNS